MTLKNLNLKLCLYILLFILPQKSFAEIAVEPLLPTGNMSIADISWAPYKMEAGEKRIYTDLYSSNGSQEFESSSMENTTQLRGTHAAAGFDYKTQNGYFTIGYNQYSGTLKNTHRESSTDSYDGYESTSSFDSNTLLLEYIHEIGSEATLGLLIVYPTTKYEMKESVNSGGLKPTGKGSQSGAAELTYVEYTLFAKFAINPQIAFGFVMTPALYEKESYDGDYGNSHAEAAHGASIDLALGYQSEKFTLEVKLHNELEQPVSRDGKVIGLGLSGEYLTGENMSIVGGIEKQNEDEVRYDGSISFKTESQDILLGLNYKIDSVTFSGDLKWLTLKNEFSVVTTQYLMLSALYNFK